MGNILVMDDDAGILGEIREFLANHGHKVVAAENAAAGLALLASEAPELVILDIYMPGMDGLEAFRRVRELRSDIPVVIMTGRSSTELTIESAKLGAFDYLEKPFAPEEMLRVVGKALHCVHLMRQNGDGRRTHEPEATPGPAIVGQSRAMNEVYKAIGRVAPTEATVLIRGESGTGKELVAQAIHRHSLRSAKPLVVVNCVAIPETLLESELFGYERGAFTGADSRRMGKFEQADGGTVLLDEIGDVPIGTQGKILRLLQEKTFERLGGNRTRRVDIRIMAATNRNLERAIAEGKFREDLYHRLMVVSIHIPPLRERSEDTPLLARHFLGRLAAGLKMQTPILTEEALAVLRPHLWPGNVRELQHCIHRAMILTQGYPIGADDIRSVLQQGMTRGATRGADGDEARILEIVREHLRLRSGPSAYEELVRKVERLLLGEALRQTSGRPTNAARLLGLPRPTLHAKMRKHGLNHQPGDSARPPA